ncbi:hypothetical protein V8C42DRAFT_332892 [Trichoderma barbatum]
MYMRVHVTLVMLIACISSRPAYLLPLSKTPCGPVLTAIGGCYGSEAIVQGLSAGCPLNVPLGVASNAGAAANLNGRGTSGMEYMQVVAVVAQPAQAHHVPAQPEARWPVCAQQPCLTRSEQKGKI